MNTSNVLKKPIQNYENAPYLDWIKSGKKQYEGRLKSKIKDWNLKIGKEIIFYDQENPDSWVLVKITCLLVFPDIGVAFDEITLAHAILNNDMTPEFFEKHLDKLKWWCFSDNPGMIEKYSYIKG